MSSWIEGVCFLFVPGDRPERFERAAAAGADAVIVDLEASVHPERKDQARDNVSRWLREPAKTHRLVRINGVATEWFERDDRMLRDAAVDGIVLPMVEGPAAVRLARAQLRNSIPFIPMIETAAGVQSAAATAQCDGVARLAFGNMDYQTQTETAGDAAMIYPSSAIVVASRAAGLPAPLAGVTAAFRDRARLDADIKFERALGFGGKLCIHPDQVGAIVDGFLPAPELLAWAERVLSASARSYAVEVDGELVDRPVIERARRLLARSRRATAAGPERDG